MEIKAPKPIKLTDTAAVTAKIAEAQGKATVRTLAVEDLLAAAEVAEKRLAAMSIPKKYREGCTVRIEPERVANSYKYRAEGTFAYLVRGKAGWALRGVYRDQAKKCPFGGSGSRKLSLSALALNHIPEIEL